MVNQNAVCISKSALATIDVDATRKMDSSSTTPQNARSNQEKPSDNQAAIPLATNLKKVLHRSCVSLPKLDILSELTSPSDSFLAQNELSEFLRNTQITPVVSPVNEDFDIQGASSTSSSSTSRPSSTQAELIGQQIRRTASVPDITIDGHLVRKNASVHTTQLVGPEDFKRIRLLGKGDTGRVYLVKLRKWNKYYAMKVLSKKEMVKRNKVKRALIEREILGNARHPFIVPLHFSFQSEKHLYLVMEYCSGGEFFRILQKQPNRRFSEETAKFYLAEVILALEYLHLMGYVYRDLKPENILLHASGHIMLSDFDLSKRSFPRKIPSVVKSLFHFFNRHVKGIDTRVCANDLRSNSFVGTEEYLAPEILHSRAHTSAVDWWTVGILLYEMLFSTTPFKGSDRYSTYHNIMETEVTFPTPSDISEPCKDFIRRCLIKDETKRLGSLHGAIDVKMHDFFKDISWALLRNMKPPLIPKVDLSRLEETDPTSNPILSNREDGLEFLVSEHDLDQYDPFRNFSSVSTDVLLSH